MTLFKFSWKKQIEKQKLEKQDEIIYELKLMNANLDNVEKRLTKLEDMILYK